MKVLYFDPILGVSGDMMLASLIDLGVSKDHLQKTLNFVPGSKIKVGRANRNGVSARTVRFTITKDVGEKKFIPLIKKSKLSARIKTKAIEIIEKIFAAERKVHHTKHLHLHELADADTLLDIVGVLVAIESLAVERIFSKPVKAGEGFIHTVEGKMPAFNLPEYPQFRWNQIQRNGQVVEEIIAAANELSADLIVLPTHGHHGFLDVLRGSVTKQVLQKSPCPVLAIAASSENG